MRVLTIAAALSLAPGAALAAELDGRTLGLAWALPFVGILLSIALFPLFASHSGSITSARSPPSGPR